MNEERKMILTMIEEGKITADEGAKLLSALGNADTKKEEKAAEPEPERSQPGYRVGQFVESLIQKVKDMDLDFNFGSSEEAAHVFEQQDVSLDTIDIHVRNGEIAFQTWDQNDVKIDCKANVYRVSNAEAAKEKLLRDTYFSIDEGKMTFKSERADVKLNIVVYVPAKEYERVWITTFNGDVTGETIHSAKAKLKTANGKVGIKSSEVKDLEAEAGNGAISVVNTNGDVCELETANGPITLDGTYKEVEAQSLNGAIRYTLLETVSGSIQLKTVNGTIQVNVPKGMNLTGDLKSTIGAITADLDNMSVVREKQEISHRMKKFKTEVDSEYNYRIDATSTAGSVTVAYSTNE
ncbi:DUF4097 family beta strand repeat-containing protein [Guptibacillus algicola]|uniref:DUF4097 family beta strand repeat-containing protein n=1 Tax=Guptibacillus algicola TaxID=225844 RepID=UPI001CD24025|nr:DUF4097 domain-containing protein [Alkalihalobacillus algicola]MCA0986830.1 DUF4097 family beta strand repeat-containing protein [Alkalihalobacillus algicola]